MSQYVVTRANTLIVVLLAALVLAVGALSWERFSADRAARAWTQHTDEVLVAITDLDLQVRRAESGQRGYLLTGEDIYLTPYRDAVGRIPAIQAAVQRLTADNPDQQRRVAALAPVLRDKLTEMSDSIRLRRSQGPEEALAHMRTDAGRADMRQIDAILGAMTAEEQRLLADRLQLAAERGALVRLLGLAGCLIAVAGLLWAARMLNQAWSRAQTAEADQRVLAHRLRASLDSLSQGVGVFGADRRLIHWNACFVELLDLPADLARSGAAYTAIAERTTAEGWPCLESEEQIRHGRAMPGEPVSYECVRPNGRQFEIRRTPTPEGGFVLTISDMTKRAQAEGVLREAQKMQAIGQLTGGIAHDFNNLLTVILGNLEVAKSRLENEPALHTRLERASWAAQRGATLTRHLLAFARRQPLEPAPIDLTQTVPAMIPLLRRTLGEPIDVRYVETAGLWPALADPAQLESAVLNLALNARDAMPNGGRLTIELANKVLDEEYAKTHVEVTPGDYAMLAVSDTGTGMTPEVLARAFEPFFTTKTDGKGTGLGLAMVFGFTKQSGGHISIYSEPGEGTTVRLYLPRAIGAHVSVAQRLNAPVDLPRGSATVLIVEDEPAVREIASAILGDLGYRVLEAADGEDAMRVFAADPGRIDLLLTDVVLPGRVRGRALADSIRAARPEVRVLFMSGYTENSIVHHGRLDDGVQLIGKPFKREQLARKVAEVLHGPATGTGVNVVALHPRRG
jgi:signal transduction histidine kinase